MKKLLIICSSIILSTSTFIHAQVRLTGDWEGLLDVGAKKVRILLHVKQDSSGYSTLMDSPDQGAVNIPIGKTEVFGDSIKLTDDKTRIGIFGILRKDNDSLTAEFVQRGARIKMALGRSAIKGFSLIRPQTPKAPFPYKVEDVIFVNKKAGNIKLAGTLTVPDNIKNPPVIITISGSGAQNRNERIFDHEPFWILADYLGRNGVAVLRFDDRGVGASEGNFRKATSYDFSTDVEAAVEFLQQRNDIDINKIGLFGHSEGGLIAPMVASRNSAIRFIISLAGPALPSDKLMIKQIQDISASEKMSGDDIANEVKLNTEIFAAIKSQKDSSLLDSGIREILIRHNFGDGKKEAHDSYMSKVMTPWFRYFITYDPAPALEKVSCPVLALNGDLDMQVNAEMNLEAMRASLKKAENKDFSLVYLKGINHAGQEARTGSVSEYRMIEQTISPKILSTISEWIHKRF